MAVDTQLERDLLALMSIADDEIDTSDAPIIGAPKHVTVGKYSGLEVKKYDIRSIANWCIKKAKSQDIEIGNMWLNKIVYFTYEKALKDFNVLLSPARIEAWDHGPVFRELYFSFSNRASSGLFEKYDIKHRRREIAEDNFDQSDIAIFEEVWLDFGHRTAAALRSLSHKSGSPWDIIWTSGGHANPGMEIDIGTILGRKVGQHHGND